MLLQWQSPKTIEENFKILKAEIQAVIKSHVIIETNPKRLSLVLHDNGWFEVSVGIEIKSFGKNVPQFRTTKLLLSNQESDVQTSLKIVLKNFGNYLAEKIETDLEEKTWLYPQMLTGLGDYEILKDM